MPTTISSAGVLTPRQNIDEFILGDTTVNRITSDPKDNSTDALVTAAAVHAVRKDIQDKLDAITKDTDDKPSGYEVLSKHIIDRTFKSTRLDTNDGWRIVGWKQTNSWDDITITNTTGVVPTNTLTIPSKQFKLNGEYLVIVEVTDITGTLQLRTTRGDVVGVCNSTGTHSFVVAVNPATTDEVYFTAVDVPLNGRVALSNCYVGSIRYELTEYVTYLLTQTLESFGDGLVTVELVRKIVDQVVKDKLNDMDLRIEEIIGEVDELLKATITSVEDLLKKHLEAKNPHHTTCEDIKAAPEDHKHEEYLNKADINSIANVVASVPTIVDRAPIGKQPSFIAGYGIGTGTPITVLSYKLNHTSRHPYDPHAGILTSTLLPVDHNMVSVHPDNPAQVAIINNTENLWTKPKKVRYQLHMNRVVNGVVIRRNQIDPSMAHPTFVQLFINGEDYGQYDLSLLNNDPVREINFAPVITDQIELSFTFPMINTIIGVGFDISFGDIPSGYEFAVPLGLAANMSTDLGIVVLPETTEMIPFSLPDTVIENHDYTVLLEADADNKLSVCVSDIVPAFNGGDRMPMTDSFETNEHPFYGKVETAGALYPDKAYLLYSSEAPNTLFPGTSGEIKHSFITPRNIDAIRLVFDDLSQLPKHLKVTAMYPADNGDIPVTLVDEDLVFFIGDSAITDRRIEVGREVRSFHISFESNTSFVVDTCDVVFATHSYDNTKNKWDDNQKRVMIAKIIKYGNGYRVVSTGLGRSGITIPVNNYEQTEIAGIYRVYNPYYTKDIDIEMVPVNAKSMQAGIVELDDQYIKIQTFTATRMLLKAQRKW